MKLSFNILSCCLLGAAICGCNNQSENLEKGTYGYDLSFFKKQNIETIELKSQDGMAKVLVVPAWQGRVMTSTTNGNSGNSYGWINHKYIESGQLSQTFNPYGGEERFWIGPEGGPFSWYFKEGVEQIYDNWDVPSVIDTEAFDIQSKTDTDVVFTKHVSLSNASGNSFSIGIKRTITLIDKAVISKILNSNISDNVKSLAYCTENTITNEGKTQWTKETGMPSIWLLGMYYPTKTTTVFIPYNADSTITERIVNDEYFGKVPSERLVVENGMIYFKIDGEYRSKIGLPKGRAKDLCGSYDSEKKVLNILKYTIPEGEVSYVNGQWGPQDDPFSGDVINSYNDGPTENGTVMGPFYEIETSSPGANLKPGSSLTHTQYTIHLEGSEEELAQIIKDVFGEDIQNLTNRF